MEKDKILSDWADMLFIEEIMTTQEREDLRKAINACVKEMAS